MMLVDLIPILKSRKGFMWWAKFIFIFVFIIPKIILATESFIAIDPLGHTDMKKDVMFTKSEEVLNRSMLLIPVMVMLLK